MRSVSFHPCWGGGGVRGGTFVEECRAALSEDRPQKAIHELVAAAVTDPAAVMRAVGEPTKGEVKTLHRSSDLTVLSLAWAPGMDLMPHDHDMWAVIGIYTGQEDNTFWRRRRRAPADGSPSDGRKRSRVLGTRRSTRCAIL